MSEELVELSRSGVQNLPVTEERYENFLSLLKTVPRGDHRIVVLREGFRLEFYAVETGEKMGAIRF